MARPIKEGLDYFPFDVDFFNDEKIQFVSARFDEKGELIAIKLLCRIYRNGYYLSWDEDMALLFSKGAGRNITPSLANDVVNELLKRGFLNQNMYKRFSILTSTGIQKRYTRICHQAGRKINIHEKYVVSSEETPVNLDETPVNSPESTQSIVKESIVKKSKINRANALVVSNETTQRELKNQYEKILADNTGKELADIFLSIKDFVEKNKPDFVDPYADAWNIVASKYGLTKVESINDYRKNKIRIRSKEEEFDFFKILQCIRKDSFYRGQNNREWKVDFNYIIESQKNYTTMIEKLNS